METNPNFERDLACYTRMVNEIEKHGINFLGIDGLVVMFEKNGKKFGQNIATWQCVPDPTRPAITEDFVIDSVIKTFEKYE
jgi:hypothetical protein